MLDEIEYLTYARKHFGKRRFDLATSGLSQVEPSELAIPVSAAADVTAFDRFAAAIAARYGVPANEVTPCLGTSGAVWGIAAAMVTQGRTVLAVEDPGYEPLWRVPAGLGARITRFRREPEENYALVPERVAQAAGPGGLAMVSDLYNPGGVRADPGALAETARALHRTGGYLIVDEVYRDFLVGREGPVTARHLGPNVITLSSLTKVYGLSWARAGWVIAPPAIAARVREAVVHAAGWNPPYASAAGVAALEVIDRLWARSVSLVGDRLAQADRFVEGHPRLSWVRPDAGLFGFVRTEPALDVSALLAGAMAEQELLVSDGKFFGRPGWFRLSVALGEPLFCEGLARLGDVVSHP